VVLPGVLVAGALAAAAIPWDRPGVGWVATALGSTVVVALGLASARPGAMFGRDAVRVAWALATFALLAVGVVRAAGWLYALCVLTAIVTGCLAAAGGRTLRGMALGAVSVPIAVIRAVPWVGRARGRATSGSSAAPSTETGGAQAAVGAQTATPAGQARSTPATAADQTGDSPRRPYVGLTVVISAILLLVFGGLLVGADAAFAEILSYAVPTVDADVLARWIFSFALVGPGTLAAVYIAVAPPRFDSGGGTGRRRTVHRVEWAAPVGVLVALFAGFVAVQATVLFGGQRHVLRTAGLTYAEYARSGFWQLSAVSVLTVLVLAVAARLAPRQTTADRAWLRALLGALALLSLVIVVSAMSRMWAYEQAYGFTRLRLLVSACELWLGGVFVAVLVAGVDLRRRATWLPGVVLAMGVTALLGLAALDPDRFIAERNIARAAATDGRLDLDYLQDLSADAVPALNRLAEPWRSCALHDVHRDLTAEPDRQWGQWNLARHRARALLAGYESPYERGWDSPCPELARYPGR
jgi:hypothetical protein